MCTIFIILESFRLQMEHMYNSISLTPFALHISKAPEVLPQGAFASVSGQEKYTILKNWVND